MSRHLPEFPIRIAFDIANEQKAVWEHSQARILTLLWRPCHIINQYYWKETLEIGRIIATEKPQTAEHLASCIRGTNYKEGDVKNFAVEALPFFTGERNVEFEFVEVTHDE